MNRQEKLIYMFESGFSSFFFFTQWKCSCVVDLSRRSWQGANELKELSWQRGEDGEWRAQRTTLYIRGSETKSCSLRHSPEEECRKGTRRWEVEGGEERKKKTTDTLICGNSQTKRRLMNWKLYRSQRNTHSGEWSSLHCTATTRHDYKSLVSY